MSDNASAPAAPATAREDTLETMWELLANATVRALSSAEPTAALLNAARQFLADNGTTLETLRNRRPSGGPLAGIGPLPFFGDEGGEGEADALHSDIPFAQPDGNNDQ